MNRELQIEIHELHARLCKAIADPKRLLIITELRGGPMTVNDLALALDLSQSNTSQHLAVLRDRGIVNVERDGLNSYYSMRSKKVLKAIDLLREFMADELEESSKLRKAAGKVPAAASRR